MHGSGAFEGGPDWRGPLADRALISSADGGYSINNAARLAYDVANMGRQLAGEPPLDPPKDGAQFHFTLPGSVQGFQAVGNSSVAPDLVRVEQGVCRDALEAPGLAIRLRGLTKGARQVEVLTHTFLPLEVKQMPGYEIGGSPLIYPGQTITARLRPDKGVKDALTVRFRLKVYNSEDELVDVDGPPSTAQETLDLKWTISDSFGSQPIQAVGVTLSSTQARLDGTVWLDYLKWDGTPQLTLKANPKAPNEFWHRSFVNAADDFHYRWSTFMVTQNRGEGIVTYGTRDWGNYRVVANDFTINIGAPSGVVIRAQGLSRYYAIMFAKEGRLLLIKALDEKRIELASKEFNWKLDTPYRVQVEVEQDEIRARVDETEIKAADKQYRGGGCGFVATEGSIRAKSLQISPAK
ncbi:hypothetical protein BJ170DRAFT_478759 [Xylariales sp. AK1849]|nr:hypothetical protein BJ170DRAFT_478759 [Xylariales sp. AK1849]